MIDVFVLCRSAEDAARRRNAAPPPGAAGPAVTFHFASGYASYCAFIRDGLHAARGSHALFCHDDIALGADLPDRLAWLITDLDRLYPNWGVAGNAGITPDGRTFHRYVKDIHGGPAKSAFPKPVLCVDGHVMLLNLARMSAAGVDCPDLAGFHGYDLALCLECLRKGLLPVADHRLLAHHASGGDQAAFDAAAASPAFQDYLAGRVTDARIPSMNGFIRIQDRLQGAAAPGGPDDAMALFDRALARALADRRPRLTLACRSQLDRLPLLGRALGTFSAAAAQAPELVDLRAVVLSDQPPERLDEAVASLRPAAPGLNLSGLWVERDPARPSRTHLMVRAFETLDADFIWFVDDDDFVFPDALRPIARGLSPEGNNVLIGSCVRYREDWEPGAARPARSVEINRTAARDAAHAFKGDNFTPLCGIVFPARIMRQQLTGVRAAGDYYEDYFFLMLAMTARSIELTLVDEPIAGISIRGAENTVTLPDRTEWNASYAAFMAELVNLPQTGSALAWNLLAQHPAAPPTPAGCLARGFFCAGRAANAWAVHRRLNPTLWAAVSSAWRLVREEGVRRFAGRMAEGR